MRRFVPDSLAAWALLILISGLVVAELVTLAAIVQGRTVNARMAGFFHLSDRVSSISRAIAGEPSNVRAALATALGSGTFTVNVGATPLAHDSAGKSDDLTELEDVMLARLQDDGITDVNVEHVAETGAAVGEAPPDDAGPVERFLAEFEQRYAGDDGYIVSVQLKDGSWINFGVPVTPPPPWWSLNALALAAAAILLVLAGSIWALRHLTAPYRLFGAAAERLGRDLNTAALPENGPREVREAARAFNLMQERLQRSFSDREQLAAAISHDLRTPVTRLRLRADYVADEEQRARMLADLAEIETMTRSVLAFASRSAEPEVREPIDVVSLLGSLCDDLPGAELCLQPDAPQRFAYYAQPAALRRCLVNLIDNAVKYGGCARVSFAVTPAALQIVVDDDGPGIPPSSVEDVFRPFRRLETSRNRETGGTGLGLTIARTVAREHGGDVTLANRPAGGLRATVVLPLAADAVAPASTSAGGGTSTMRPAA